jgi:adenylate cyclase
VATTTAASKRSRRRLIELACICLAVAQVGWFILPYRPSVIRSENTAQDWIIGHGPRQSLDKDFVFVAVDDLSMKLDQLWPEDIAASPPLQSMQKGWPWTRDVFAAALEKILTAGARAVVVDIVFDNDRGHEGDLKSVLDRYRSKIVLGAAISEDAFNPSHFGSVTSEAVRTPSTSLLPTPQGDPRMGYVNFSSDIFDGIIRSATYRSRPGHTGHKDEASYQSLAAATLRQIGRADSVPDDELEHLFRYGDYSNLKVVSFYSLFMPQDWKTAMRNGEIFRDKIVVIGPTAPILHDILPTPYGSMAGANIHLSAISAAMHGSFYFLASPLVSKLIVLFAAVFTLLVTWKVRNPLFALVVLVGIVASYFVLVFVVANHLDYLMPVVIPGWTVLLAGIGCTSWNFSQARRESGRMRSTLERYVSRNVVREILDNRDDFLSALGGTRRPMTVFFSDVRGFTSFAEKEDAHSVVGQLNEYLGEMVGIIFRYQGTVDKFMGDGIMAVWGNVVSEGAAKDAANAVNAALEMLEKLKHLNEGWQKRDLAPFAIGIGLHHGEAVFGNIGSAEKMEPTVIGDTVNLASRVEGLTKKYGVTLCITQPLAELVTNVFSLRSVDLVQVVGKSRPVEIFTVLGKHDQPRPDWIKCYESAIADFRARRFAEAAASLRLCVEAAPEDKLSRIYLERTTAFLASPPPEGWNGAEIATSK